VTEAFTGVVTGAIGAVGGAVMAFVSQAGLSHRREATLVERVLQPHLDRIRFLETGEADCRERADRLSGELAELRAELRYIRQRTLPDDSGAHTPVAR